MKHKSSGHFSELCSFLETADSAFRYSEMAALLKSTTQKIRRLRNGETLLDAMEIEVLMKHYHMNPMYLVAGEGPKFLVGDNAVSEPRIEYATQSNLKKEKQALKQRLEEKDKLIEAYEKLLKKK